MIPISSLKKCGAAVLGFLILLLTLGAFRAGKKVERTDNLEAHIKGGKTQRKAEDKLDKQMEEKVDEIRNTDDTSDRLTKQPRL